MERKLAMKKNRIQKTSHKKYLYLVLIIIFMGQIIGCSEGNTSKIDNGDVKIVSVQTTVQQENYPTWENYKFITSEPNKVTLHGKLLVTNPDNVLPADNNAIYLAQLNEDGATIASIPLVDLSTAPQADVDERTGEFVFANINPGHYAVIVLTTTGVQMPARRYGDSGLAIYRINDDDKGKIIELGSLSLP